MADDGADNQQALPDRGHLLTEQRLAASAALDALSVEDALRVINDQDALIAGVVRDAIPRIAQLVETIVAGLKRGGRLIYIGAGTSGRLGVLDASECPPTFHCDAGQVVGVIAGGDAALRRSSEGMEDDPDGARDELERLNIGEHDTVIGIAAGGTTPYVLGALEIAQSRGAATALVTCVSESQVEPSRALRARSGDSAAGSVKASNSHQDIDHLICLPVGPEVVTGSTRMKAGTATKLVLNMVSTATMVRLGKVWGNLMIDLRATNAKLRDRAARILAQQCGLERDAALELLDVAGGRVKPALVMHHKGVDAAGAQRMLDEHDQQLRPLLGPPR